MIDIKYLGVYTITLSLSVYSSYYPIVIKHHWYIKLASFSTDFLILEGFLTDKQYMILTIKIILYINK